MHENFFHSVKVYYEDTDAGGVVYYANYLKFLERARTEALFTIGFNNKKIKEDYGALIVVKSITKTSFVMFQFISRDDELIVDAKVHLVFVDKDGKPMKVPEIFFKDFKPYFCDSIKIK